MGTAADLRWVHSHHNGTPILMTSTTGVAVPHGDHTVMGFPGQFANAKQIAGAQHYYNRYRDYNPVTGRYIQADPIGLAGDANPYAYAMGNALRYMDADGLDAVVLNDTFAGSGWARADHQGMLIGNDQTGWGYYSKDGAAGNPNKAPFGAYGPTLPTGRGFFPTLSAALASPDLSRYERAIRIPASPAEDALMRAAAQRAYNRSYNVLTDNCGDLVREALRAAGLGRFFGSNVNPAWQRLHSNFGRNASPVRFEPPGSRPNPK